jgi:hypothetical protein
METFEVVPLTNVNIRSGPGIAFEIEDQIPAGYNLTITKIVKDGSGTPWYKCEQGWVNSKYVKQPNQLGAEAKAKSTATALSSVTEITGKLTGIVSGALGGSTGLASSISSGILGSLGAITSSGTQDAILSRRIYGTPFQFIADTDMRPNDGPLGINFMTNIMTETPIISILPGVPKYMAEMSPVEKKTFTDDMIKKLDTAVDSVKSQFTDAFTDNLDKNNIDMAFFEFQSATAEYMLYVNLLCRMCAMFMGIGSLPVPGTSDQTYGSYNWFNWHLSNAYANKSTEIGGVGAMASDISGIVKGGVDKVVKSIMGNSDANLDGYAKIQKSMNGISSNSNNYYYADQYFFDFFIKPPSYSESFSNQTTESMFSQVLSKASGIQKELAFLLGEGGAEARKVLEGNAQEATKAIEAATNQLFKSEGMKKILNRLVTGANTVITGANIVFPQIWDTSSYNRDFQVEITLSTPYGTPESVFLEEMVPMMHLLALTLPRQATVNSYGSPFLVRATVPGYFYSDMGIVKDLQISKGGQSGNSWTVDGLPTEINISMNISDLYNSLSMSNFKTKRNIWNTLYNAPLLDYIGVQCGLNMRSSEYVKKIELVSSLLKNVWNDQVDYTMTKAREMAAMSQAKILAGKG